ncbi:hypothetical protein HELRODRAFT_164367 [Helobdella robusta]|uniref:EF-hand domain-containing protein n=1 Tax=Helobdella robusta TaxID=6412 RepID=T1EVB7_HELRO|nr:hypothetical protein HELRODRAFT_164367 [Helobdella robusta]ESN94511.1 hypothetical protein HELRODRAFT_164367 [Helobdella robusta]
MSNELFIHKSNFHTRSRDRKLLICINTEAQDIFSTFSKSNDNTINVDEVGAFIRSMGLNPSEAQVQLIQGQLNQFVEDESLSFQTVMDVLKSFESIQDNDCYENLLRAFHFFDPANTGYIMMNDLKRVLMNKGEPLSDDEIFELLKHANVDKKGRIKYIYLAQRLSKNIL